MKNAFLIIIILVLLVGSIYTGMLYKNNQKELNQVKSELKIQKTNDKVLAFTKFFIVNVLNASAEVDFDTRLKLENIIRDLNDQEIFNEWQKFTGSKTEAEAQIEVKNLLKILVDKIKS